MVQSKMTPIKIVFPACAALLIGCAPPAGPDVTQVIAPTVIATIPGPAPADTEDQCWEYLPSPPSTELVEQTIKVAEATFDDDGRELTPAIYRRAKVEVETEGTGQHFARLCDAQLTPSFVETLQRALQARGVYQGQVTGVLGAATKAAVGRYQRDQGLDSDVLSLSAARQLGLVAVDLPTPEPEIEPFSDVEADADASTEPRPRPRPEAEPDAED